MNHKKYFDVIYETKSDDNLSIQVLANSHEDAQEKAQLADQEPILKFRYVEEVDEENETCEWSDYVQTL